MILNYGFKKILYFNESVTIINFGNIYFNNKNSKFGLHIESNYIICKHVLK